MYPLTQSLDFPVTAPHLTTNEGWDDDYSDPSDDDSDFNHTQHSFDDVQDSFGLVEPTHIIFGEAGFEDIGHSDDSDSDDDENEPIEFDDLPSNPNHGNTRKLPSSSCCSTPFWFGDEDPRTFPFPLAHMEKPGFYVIAPLKSCLYCQPF